MVRGSMFVVGVFKICTMGYCDMNGVLYSWYVALTEWSLRQRRDRANGALEG